MSFQQYPQRDTVRNYFPLPNEIFSLDLTTGELATYAYLLYIENRESYQCRASYATIGRAIRRGKKTVMRYVGGLIEKRLITVEPTLVYPAGEKPRNGSLLYTIRPIQEAVDYKNERQLAKADAARERHRVQKLLAKQHSQIKHVDAVLTESSGESLS